MKNVDIARAWKDASYRSSLTQEQLDQLPTNPAGVLSEETQNMISGGLGNGNKNSGNPTGAGTNPDECYWD